MIEVLKNVKPFPQPSPKVNPGGDCFACALKAVVDYFYPEKPADFMKVWEAFKRDAHGGGKVLSNTWPTMQQAHWALREDGYRFEHHIDLAIASSNVDYWSHAWGLRIDEGAWAYRMEAWLAAGWIGLIEMAFDGEGPVSSNGLLNHTDHFAVIDGQRHFWKPHVSGGATFSHESHVVCSARGAYWISTGELLHKHGVGAVLLLRRDRRD